VMDNDNDNDNDNDTTTTTQRQRDATHHDDVCVLARKGWVNF
jgi:hypothetical protein